MLVEIPTRDETFDNIVAFWNSGGKAAEGPGAAVRLQALLVPRNPVWPRDLATARATRTGIGGIVGQKRSHFSWRFVVDFAGGDFGPARRARQRRRR